MLFLFDLFDLFDRMMLAVAFDAWDADGGELPLQSPPG
jgi:hypothetical protein